MVIHTLRIPTPYAVGDVNAYLVKGDTLTLFDVGPKTTEAYDALKWSLHTLGYRLEDIEQIVLTHHHPDHIGLVDAFPNAALYGHSYVDHWLQLKPTFITYIEAFYNEQLQRQHVPIHYATKMMDVQRELEQFGAKPLTATLQEGDTVPGLPTMAVYYTPGHAQSHLLFVDETTNVCIGGDLLLAHVSSNPLIEPPIDLQYTRPRALLQYNASLQKLADLNVDLVYGGHGKPVEHVNALIAERLQRQHERAMKVYTLLQPRQTAFDVTTKLFPTLYDKQPALTLSETLGQLDYLVAQQLVEEQLVDGIMYYMPIK